MMGLNNEPMVIYSDSYRVARQVGVQPEGKKRQEIPVQRNIDYREKALVVRNKLEAYFPKTRVIGISVEDNAMAERLI